MKKITGTKGINTLTVIAASLFLFSACKKPPVCKGITATGERKITGQTATVTSTAGYLTGDLEGNTTASFSVTGTDPQTGKQFYEGDFTLTSPTGMLTCRIQAGSLNPATGEFNNSAIITAGKGDYAGAQGVLYFHGFNTHAIFVDDKVSGEICKAKTHYIK